MEQMLRLTLMYKCGIASTSFHAKSSSLVAGCDFGDRATWCSQTSSLSDSCKDPGWASTCCKSCASFVAASGSSRSTPTIGTGESSVKADLSGDCSSKTSDQCYTLAGSCCTTCYRHYTDIKGLYSICCTFQRSSRTKVDFHARYSINDRQSWRRQFICFIYRMTASISCMK